MKRLSRLIGLIVLLFIVSGVGKLEADAANMGTLLESVGGASFYDSNSDGYADIMEVTQNLDYMAYIYMGDYFMVSSPKYGHLTKIYVKDGVSSIASGALTFEGINVIVFPSSMTDFPSDWTLKNFAVVAPKGSAMEKQFTYLGWTVYSSESDISSSAKPTPTTKPTSGPTATPSVNPTSGPTATPSVNPTSAPTTRPSVKPTATSAPTPTNTPVATPVIPQRTPVPVIPNDFKATYEPVASGLNVQWDISVSSESYSLVRTDSKGKKVEINDLAKIYYIDKKVKNGEKYTYTVYAKSKTGNIKACKKNVTAVYLSKPSTLKLKAVGNGKLKISYSKNSKASGYTISYALSPKFEKAKTITVSKKSTVTKTISKLKSKSKYYVRVRAYKKIGSKKYYGAWSKTVSVKIK